ncbi:energy-coupling factor transporter transmembrane component T family protein [Limnoglobus roseus]|uniref:Cobalt ECF transporter T component CbiQ n=1 Tax=Limnoglobus roseus TaxID=2598579 RepID=A0A5C1AMF1_9BACT|nr:energy-coupling factor transporter transmembrane component T [Limnoglobus roseus]QEL20150.1 cobalt ECF transporter T component CbiQ [Limnoglobus roseus]
MSLACQNATVPDSPLARWDARYKLAGLFVLAFGVAVLQRPQTVGCALALVLVLTFLAKISARRVLARVGLLLVAVLPFVVVLPFASDHGLELAALIAGRCVTIGLIGLILAATATLPRTLAAAQSLGVPSVLVLVAQLAWRYVFVLLAEARRLRVALQARAFPVRTNAHTYRTIGHVTGALLVRGGERADRVAAAMRCRGFDGTPRGLTPFRATAFDVFALLLVVGGTIALVAWDRL